jgi:peptide/nickel transport system substrate-binding protein
MKRELRVLAAAGSPSLLLLAANAAFAQKSGGILKIGHFNSPASMSMLEESTQAVNRPMSGLFNNLVIFKQDQPQNTRNRSCLNSPLSGAGVRTAPS